MDYSVLIHTCDKYRDCWKPFFKCFNKYWTDPFCDIYLVNEVLDVDEPQIKTGGGAWSDRLLKALDELPDKPIFYMLEDFWITKEIDIRKYFELFESLKADSLRIADKTGRVTTLNHMHDNLYSVGSKGRYVLSCQPTFWKKSFLQSALIRGEDPWQFEIDGTNRLHKQGYDARAYFVDEDWYIGAYRKGKIIPEGAKYLEELNG